MSINCSHELDSFFELDNDEWLEAACEPVDACRFVAAVEAVGAEEEAEAEAFSECRAEDFLVLAGASSSDAASVCSGLSVSPVLLPQRTEEPISRRQDCCLSLSR